MLNCINDVVELQKEIVACQRCPRLIRYCREVAETKRRAYRQETYWGRPVPSFGDPAARVLLVGLAPAAHGGNRTGRVFTGDRSADFLYRALYETGFASQPESKFRGDGLKLSGAWVTCAAHCAPPDNKPLPEEVQNCLPWLQKEMELLSHLRVVVALGKIAFDAFLSLQQKQGVVTRRKPFVFGHNRLYSLGEGHPLLLSSYHPSQQNTSTGKLTLPMMLDVMNSAREKAF